MLESFFFPCGNLVYLDLSVSRVLSPTSFTFNLERVFLPSWASVAPSHGCLIFPSFPSPPPCLPSNIGVVCFCHIWKSHEMSSGRKEERGGRRAICFRLSLKFSSGEERGGRKNLCTNWKKPRMSGFKKKAVDKLLQRLSFKKNLRVFFRYIWSWHCHLKKSYRHKNQTFILSIACLWEANRIMEVGGGRVR